MSHAARAALAALAPPALTRRAPPPPLCAVDAANERPRAHIFVSAAGKVVPFAAGVASDFYKDEDEAAAKLQAMHKARRQRMENAERKEAAKRVQAAKRGQKARKEAREQREAAVKMQAINRGRAERKKRAA